MNRPFAALTVLQAFVAGLLANDADVQAAFDDDVEIYPNISPEQVDTRHITHTDYGSIQIAKPVGAPIAMVTMRWAITAWEPSPSQQALEPLMEAVMKALIGYGLEGREHRYVDGDRTWSIYVDYAGPDIVEPEITPVGTWAPLRETYTMALQQIR